jgi:hypothetical protein
MKRLAILVSCTAVLASAADLAEVHNVYLLRMTRGFDQYLANHLTGGKVFQVVTDPKLADTIITEQIGEGFETKLNELFPPPEPEAPPKPEKPADKDVKGKSAKEEEAPADSGLITDTVNKLANPTSSFGRGKGMVFLVDAKSKQVIWSAYGLPKDSTSKELDRTALDIVSRIKHDLKKK